MKEPPLPGVLEGCCLPSSTGPAMPGQVRSGTQGRRSQTGRGAVTLGGREAGTQTCPVSPGAESPSRRLSLASLAPGAQNSSARTKSLFLPICLLNDVTSCRAAPLPPLRRGCHGLRSAGYSKRV